MKISEKTMFALDSNEVAEALVGFINTKGRHTCLPVKDAVVEIMQDGSALVTWVTDEAIP